MKANQMLFGLATEFRRHPFVGLIGFAVGVVYAVGASYLDRIALRHQSAILGADALANLPSFLFAILLSAVLLWILVLLFARKRRGAVFLVSICIGAVAGLIVYTIARELAG